MTETRGTIIDSETDKCFSRRRENMYRVLRGVYCNWSAEENIHRKYADRAYIMPDGGGYKDENKTPKDISG